MTWNVRQDSVCRLLENSPVSVVCGSDSDFSFGATSVSSTTLSAGAADSVDCGSVSVAVFPSASITKLLCDYMQMSLCFTL